MLKIFINSSVLGLKQLSGYTYRMEVFSEVLSVMDKYVQSHLENFDPNCLNDLMDVMIANIKSTSDPDSSFFENKGMVNMFHVMLDMFFAGMETTNSSILWTILYLLHHPDIQEKVHDEIIRVSVNTTCNYALF